MRSAWSVLFTLLLLQISCEQQEVFDDVSAIEEQATINNNHPKISYITLDDIDPAVMKHSGFNKLIHKTNTTAKTITTNFGIINTDRIMQTIGEEGIENYTFLVNVEDNNPKEFYNLIIRKRVDGSFAKPYVKKYTMTDAFYEVYLETGSLDGFAGSFINIDVSGY